MIISVALLLFVAGCTGGDPYTDADDEWQQEIPDPIGEQTAQELPEIVAEINGEQILREEVQEAQSQMQMQGAVVEPQEVLSQILTRKVLIKEAENRGYTPSTEEVEQNFESQGLTLEEVREIVEGQGVPYDEFLQMQLEELKLQGLMTQKAEQIEITEESAREFYDEQVQMGAELEEYDLIRDDIVAFMAQDEANTKLLELAQQLIDESDVQIYI